MTRSSPDEGYFTAAVPADVDRPDTVLFGLTARQLLLLAGTGLTLWAGWALAGHLAPIVYLIAAVPVAGAGFVVAVGRRDGQPLDTWLRRALTHHRGPSRLVPADGPIRPAPAWIATTGPVAPPPAPLQLPARGISPDGTIDLADDGTTTLVAAGTVNFGLRSPSEQTGLIGGFARWLHSLDGPVQILLRAQRVDMAVLADRITRTAPGLPHPALEAAARGHAQFLDQLAAERQLLHRQVTVAVRDTRGPAHAAHRATETVRALAGCEVRAQCLDAEQATATLTGCLNPAVPPTAEVTL